MTEYDFIKFYNDVEKLKSNFSIGDKVRIKHWSTLQDEWGLDSEGNISAPLTFFKGMKSLCGQVFEITEIDGIFIQVIDGFLLNFSLFEKINLN